MPHWTDACPRTPIPKTEVVFVPRLRAAQSALPSSQPGPLPAGEGEAGPPPTAGVAGEPRDAGLPGRETKGEVLGFRGDLEPGDFRARLLESAPGQGAVVGAEGQSDLLAAAVGQGI